MVVVQLSNSQEVPEPGQSKSAGGAGESPPVVESSSSTKERESKDGALTLPPRPTGSLGNPLFFGLVGISAADQVGSLGLRGLSHSSIFANLQSPTISDPLPLGDRLRQAQVEVNLLPYAIGSRALLNGELEFRDCVAALVLGADGAGSEIASAQTALSFRAALRVIGGVKPEVRRELASWLIDFALASSQNWKIFARFSHSICQHLPNSELVYMLGRLIERTNTDGKRGVDRERARETAISILRGCHNLKQVESVIKEVGLGQMLALGGTRIERLAVAAILLPRLSKQRLVRVPNTNLRARDVERLALECRFSLENLIEVIDNSPLFRRTEPARHLKEILGREIKSIRGEERRAEDLRPKAFREFLALVMQRAEFARKFMGNLTVEKNRANRPMCSWNCETIAELMRGLKLAPSVPLFCAPSIREIKRSKGSKDEYMEVNTVRGRLQIYDDVVDALKTHAADGSGRMIVATLMHESGHVIQLPRRSKHHIDVETGLLSNSGEICYDFADWCALSGWRGVPRGEYRMGNNSTSVRIDGQIYSLDVPVMFRGEQVVFEWDAIEKDLFYYNAGAKFVVNSYSRTGPWEDFAESFAAYVLKPDDLKEIAPEKYQFMELHFGYATKRPRSR